ncbi:MAG: flavodoxin family protein [Candidatus Aenigmatarchaeota archaeon]
MKDIFVLGINGSPHKDGSTAKLLKKFLKSVEKYGGQTELVNLAEYDIRPCLGCYSRNPKLCKYPCNIKDDMQKIYPLLVKSDAIAFGTPIYWFNMSGLMKNFIDRLTCFAPKGYMLEGKVGIFFAVSKENEGGRLNATLSMAYAMNHLGLWIPPYGLMFYPAKEKIVKNGKIVWDNWVFSDASKISKNIVHLCRFLKKS